MITQTYKLNIIPSFNGPVIVKCSQYDKDSRSIEFSLFDGANPFVLDNNYTITVRGTKKDGTAFEYDCSIEDDKVVFLLNQQMTLFDGKYLCELRIINNSEILGSSNFTLFVEKSPIDENAIISESDLPAYEKLLNDLQGEKISDWLDENIAQETGYVLDSSLTVQGAAADAKAVGNALAVLEEKIDDGSGSGTGLTDEIAQALLACFQNVAWVNTDGQDYYTALEEALENAGGVRYTVTNLLTKCTSSNSSIKATEGKRYIAVLTANSGYTLSTVTVTMGGIDVTGTYYSGGTISIPNVTGDIVITAVATSLVSSITAVFTQGDNIIYTNDSLDSLKQYLVVTANYSGGNSEIVTDYELSGTLGEGTRTITVNYGGKTDTFDVVCTVDGWLYHFEQSLASSGSEDLGFTGNVTYGEGHDGVGYSLCNNPECAFATGYTPPSLAEDFTISFWAKTVVNKNGQGLSPYFARTDSSTATLLANTTDYVATGWSVTVADVTKVYSACRFGSWVNSKAIATRLYNTSLTKGALYSATPPSSFDSTQWHHYAWTRTNRALRFFVDGKIIFRVNTAETLGFDTQCALGGWFDTASPSTPSSNKSYYDDLFIAEYCKWGNEVFDPASITY